MHCFVFVWNTDRVSVKNIIITIIITSSIIAQNIFAFASSVSVGYRTISCSALYININN